MNAELKPQNAIPQQKKNLRLFVFCNDNVKSNLDIIAEEFKKHRNNISYVVIPDSHQKIKNLAEQFGIIVEPYPFEYGISFPNYFHSMFDSLMPNAFLVFGNSINDSRSLDYVARFAYYRNVPAIWL